MSKPYPLSCNQEKCREFNTHHLYYPTFMEAVALHIRLMHTLSQTDVFPKKSNMPEHKMTMVNV